MVDLECSLAVTSHANLFLQSENLYWIGRKLHLPFLMLDSYISFSWWHTPGTDRHFGKWETQQHQSGWEFAVFAITCSHTVREIALSSNHRCLLNLKREGRLGFVKDVWEQRSLLHSKRCWNEIKSGWCGNIVQVFSSAYGDHIFFWQNGK